MPAKASRRAPRVQQAQSTMIPMRAPSAPFVIRGRTAQQNRPFAKSARQGVFSHPLGSQRVQPALLGISMMAQRNAHPVVQAKLQLVEPAVNLARPELQIQTPALPPHARHAQLGGTLAAVQHRAFSVRLGQLTWTPTLALYVVCVDPASSRLLIISRVCHVHLGTSSQMVCALSSVHLAPSQMRAGWPAKAARWVGSALQVWSV